MYCNKCGAKIDEGKQFCGKCGALIMNYSVYKDDSDRQNLPAGVMPGKPSFQKMEPHESGFFMHIWNKVIRLLKEGMGPLILGILALLLDCSACASPSLGLVAIIPAVLGLVYGSKQYKEIGSPQANAGKIMSIIALVLVWICILVGVITASF